MISLVVRRRYIYTRKDSTVKKNGEEDYNSDTKMFKTCISLSITVCKFVIDQILVREYVRISKH